MDLHPLHISVCTVQHFFIRLQVTAKFRTGLLKAQPKLAPSSLFHSFQALPPSTLNMGEAIPSDSKGVPAREHPVESSRTPSVCVILSLTNFLFWLISYHLQLQFLIHSEVCVWRYTRIYKCKKPQISKSLNL